jgi:hypothetical protein
MCSGFEAGTYLRRIDSCITQLMAQRPFRTCNESKEEEEVFTLRANHFAAQCFSGGGPGLEGICKATWKREYKLPWRQAGPPNHLNKTVVSDQLVANQELFL